AGVITLWHVLEHLENPLESIRKLSENLLPGGSILVAVPNHKSADARHYGKHWAGLDVPRHLWHFTQHAISLLARKAGLTVQQVLPMKFDAYYVSMLSEGYKTGSPSGLMNLIKGSWSGLRSNLRARKTGEYSSLIYVLKK
ncbi:MAG: class I SAM-dependent methyltransferase, partial [Bacteroidota bacterium]